VMLSTRVIWSFRDRYGHLPSLIHPNGDEDLSNEDASRLFQLRIELGQQEGFSGSALDSALPLDFLHQVSRVSAVEFGPTSAIFGGLIAAEVVKVVSGKDEPYNNVMLFNAHTSTAIVKRLPPLQE